MNEKRKMILLFLSFSFSTNTHVPIDGQQYRCEFREITIVKTKKNEKKTELFILLLLLIKNHCGILFIYNHNNEKMTSVNPKIAHPDLQPFMSEDAGVSNLGMNNFSTIFEEATAKDTESNFGNLEMRKDARPYVSNYAQYPKEVDDEKTDDESEEYALLVENLTNFS